MLTLASSLLVAALQTNRPPAVPLVTHDPYFSVWSFNDKLTDGTTRHWTGADHPLVSLIKIDGKPYRLMGAEPSNIPALPQTSLAVLPTRTIYNFAGNGVEVSLRFTSPLLPHDLDLFSRPATYITWTVKSTDSAKHDVSVYFAASPRLAVNRGNQTVNGSISKGLITVSSVDQPVLEKRGDDLRIDWGHLLLGTKGKAFFGGVDAFLGSAATSDSIKDQPAEKAAFAATALEFGEVSARPASQHVTLGYDDEYSVELMQNALRPYWRRKGLDAAGMMALAEKQYASVEKKCEKFDAELLAELEKAGGADYAYIGSLAFRQSYAAQKLVADSKGQPLMFSKENFSNGCMATVDVLYPAAPQLLLFGPTLMKASLTPIMQYAASPRWKFPFAPHDMGQYPKANGQVYGGGERTEDDQMPVEESGNMLILLAALAKQEGNAKYSATYWPILTRWTEYLASKGFDPERQLCTDDFAGHLGHNVNLSAKAILGIKSYAYLAQMLGKTDEAAKYDKLAREFAVRWQKEAVEGGRSRLAFDQPGTWSQKYNLVWDRLLGFDLFPASVAKNELAFYKSKQNKYGLPLDNRRDYTKLDWILWTATLTGNDQDFRDLISPVVRFLNETPSRVPMSDWYSTASARQEGFQARSVVGGVFIKLLDTEAWARFTAGDPNKAKGWADLPVPPKMEYLLSPVTVGKVDWRWIETAPASGWEKPGFDDSSWRIGAAGFGEGDNRGGANNTRWKTRDIWIRNTFDLGAVSPSAVRLVLAHDDGAVVHINGIRAVSAPNAGGYEAYRLPKAVLASLKPMGNTIAIHCHDDGGDRYIDAGIAYLVK